jgi:hypothetical protein
LLIYREILRNSSTLAVLRHEVLRGVLRGDIGAFGIAAFRAADSQETEVFERSK